MAGVLLGKDYAIEWQYGIPRRLVAARAAFFAQHQRSLSGDVAVALC
jgi:hypothetical protein